MINVFFLLICKDSKSLIFPFNLYISHSLDIRCSVIISNILVNKYTLLHISGTDKSKMNFYKDISYHEPSYHYSVDPCTSRQLFMLNFTWYVRLVNSLAVVIWLKTKKFRTKILTGTCTALRCCRLSKFTKSQLRQGFKRYGHI